MPVFTMIHLNLYFYKVVDYHLIITIHVIIMHVIHNIITQNLCVYKKQSRHVGSPITNGDVIIVYKAHEHVNIYLELEPCVFKSVSF